MREIENAERFFAEADNLTAWLNSGDDNPIRLKAVAALYDARLGVEDVELGSTDWLRALILIAAFRELAEAKEDE
jgi:hypothetical protein